MAADGVDEKSLRKMKDMEKVCSGGLREKNRMRGEGLADSSLGQ